MIYLCDSGGARTHDPLIKFTLLQRMPILVKIPGSAPTVASTTVQRSMVSVLPTAPA